MHSTLRPRLRPVHDQCFLPKMFWGNGGSGAKRCLQPLNLFGENGDTTGFVTHIPICVSLESQLMTACLGSQSSEQDWSWLLTAINYYGLAPDSHGTYVCNCSSYVFNFHNLATCPFDKQIFDSYSWTVNFFRYTSFLVPTVLCPFSTMYTEHCLILFFRIFLDQFSVHISSNSTEVNIFPLLSHKVVWKISQQAKTAKQPCIGIYY